MVKQYMNAASLTQAPGEPEAWRANTGDMPDYDRVDIMTNDCGLRYNEDPRAAYWVLGNSTIGYWRPHVAEPTPIDDGLLAQYALLTDVLRRAWEQAAVGKGKERHANDTPFHLQPMQQIAKRRGIGFILGQADKKSEEAQGMLHRGDTDAFTREILGAIVYLAGAIIHAEENEGS